MPCSYNDVNVCLMKNGLPFVFSWRKEVNAYVSRKDTCHKSDNNSFKVSCAKLSNVISVNLSFISCVCLIF